MRIRNLLMLLCVVGYSVGMSAATLFSPDANYRVEAYVNEQGVPYYELFYKEKTVVYPSKLGYDLIKPGDLKDDFELVNVSRATADETWSPVLGEVASICNHYNQMTLNLKQKRTGIEIAIQFRLFNDGLGFRYLFPRQDALGYFQIKEELTQFKMSGDHKAFWIPGAYDTNEFYYTTTNLSQIDATKVDGVGIGTNTIFHRHGVQSPLMMKSNDGLYINVFEAALVDYSAMQLMVDTATFTLSAHLVPDAIGVKGFMQTPCTSPWRTVLVSDNAAALLESKTILNLNEPCAIEDVSWIKPVKYMGIWWGMHLPHVNSWNYAHMPNIRLETTDWKSLIPYGRHGATTENAKKYIDFAAENGFDALLIEGWNVGWEDWAGNWKEDVFDFVTPYPDFDLPAVRDYAKDKGVELIMHHETSASATNYERRVDKAFDFMLENGYKSVKTGYVGWIIPRGEKHDGQWMVNHYQRIIEKAAEKKIMINQHEPVRPTGTHRTYPNYVAAEAARGNEFNAWSAGNPPEHETILPFTRLMGGPMDYTPGIFEIKMSYYEPGNPCQVHTTLAKQLALYVTMYSPVQMAADLPESYAKRMDAFQFIKDVDVDWRDTKILEAEPGDYITIARLGKKTNNWFVGAITDENSRVATIDLSFLTKGKEYVATIYADAKEADWKANPMAYAIQKVVVTNKTILRQKLANGGGCAISFEEVSSPAQTKGLKRIR